MINNSEQIDNQINIYYEIPRLISTVRIEEPKVKLTAEQAIGIMIVQRLDKLIDILSE